MFKDKASGLGHQAFHRLCWCLGYKSRIPVSRAWSFEMFDGMTSTASSGRGALRFKNGVCILRIAFRQDLLDYVSRARRVPRHKSPDPNPYETT